MKVTVSTLFILLFFFCVSGQESRLRTKRIEASYSCRNATAEQPDSFYFDLQPVRTTKFKSHFRISLTGQIIDFYSLDNVKFQGKLTNYIVEYRTVKRKKDNYGQSIEHQYVIEQIDLEQTKIAQFVDVLISSGQPEIPTDTLITSWQHNFLHCNSLVFQFNRNGKYTKQIFHCPWSQKDSVEFKSIILNNYEKLKSTFQLDSLYDSFESKLPKGKAYSRDGYRMMYKMTDQQSENWKKSQPQRDLMKSVKDTVDSHINSELKKQDMKLSGISCFIDYQLTFGKNGKLKSVKPFYHDKPTLKKSLGLFNYIGDVREIKKCKRKIKQLFSTVDLSFLNVKTEIYRTFSFDHNKQYLLRDDTIY